ncbi:MAG: ATP-binding cassette domain-containing protein [Pseudomonadota bacterium]
MSNAVQLHAVSKSFQDGDVTVGVLNNLSCQVAPGSSLAITGPSGSGKSTLLNLLAGTLTPDSGEIFMHLGGQDVAWHNCSERIRTRTRRRWIGYVHQFFNLIPTLTVLENVRLPGRLNKQRQLDAQALELLQQFGLGHRLHNFPETLSGGEQQRVAVARALLLQPALLLADEPTGNLDRGNSTQVADLLFTSARASGAALIVATHSSQVAARADQQLQLGVVE